MKINAFFKKYNRVTVALSGGVDSAVLLLLAKKYADEVYACFVKSEFQPEFEAKDAKEICDMLGVKLDIIHTSVLEDVQITANPANRCYYCKMKIFTEICSFARRHNSQAVEGTNFSDDIADRAGFLAINELGVLSPLRICGLMKSDIRQIAAEHHLPVFNKPSYACLATRIPCGTKITNQLLHNTEQAENILFDLGFSDFRVRYRNGDAVLELTQKDRIKYNDQKNIIDKKLKIYYNHIYLSDKVR
ncbi:MAG: ATP-dependent sacrificial sulfur transferase LarE [Clostridium sp.]|nr:ATP-dependent sacrificial sulfur transferase LarE [Clostridium sp.]